MLTDSLYPDFQSESNLRVCVQGPSNIQET